MIIEINRPNDPTTFDKIKEGDAFLFSSILYVKIVPATHNYCQSANALNLVSYVLFDGQLFLKIHETQRHNTVSLSNNFPYMIECTAVVEPKKVRLVVE